MAFRYRQITPQTGDFINPDDWNVNVREFTNEFNGHLDRDNLPELGISSASIKPKAFHEVFSDSQTTDFTVEEDQTRFIDLQVIEFEIKQQGLLVCEWSGTWEFILPELDLHAVAGVQKVDYKISVNGFDICTLFHNNNLQTKSNGYMVGALPIEAGFVRIAVEVRTVGTISDGIDIDGGFTLLNQPEEGSVIIRDRELLVVLRKA